MSAFKTAGGSSPVDSRFNETCGADDDALVEQLLQEILEQIASGAREGCR